jgi:adenylate cyclase
MSFLTSEAKRHLATVLVADVVGFSRRMGENERATVTALIECRKLLTKIVEAHQGQIIGTPGDFFLAILPSGYEAVYAAIEIQGQLSERNLAVEEPHRAEYRIGIGIGDIYMQDNDVLGDAVNIASRLQTLAPPGGIVASGAARDIVGAQEGFAFEYLGDQMLKNLVMPVRAYAVVRTSATAAAFGGNGPTGHQPSSLLDRPPVKPVVEIETFRPKVNGDDERLFALGLTEELVGILAGLANSLMVRQIDEARSHSAIGVGEALRLYRLGGSVRRVGSSVKITAHLTAQASGVTIWSDRFDYSADESFDVQEVIAREVVTAIQVTLTEGDQALN